MAPIFWHFDTVAFEYGPVAAILLCLFFAVVYVGSLYVWTPGQHGRDHPSTVKLRFLRVGLVCILMIPFLWACSVNSYSVRARILFTWIGLRLQGLITAGVLPLLLTVVLFLGPLTLHYLDGIFSIYKDPEYWLANVKNLIWLRNHVVAPFTEEFIFRACMLPLLVPCFGEHRAIFICPLFFGVAHFHHMVEQMKNGKSLREAIAMSLFQFGYTTLFGAYSAFLFLRTGHLMAPAVAHAFCNHMGFPNFQEVMAYANPKRGCVIAMFLLGLVLWGYLLYPLTEPALYGNNLYHI